ncbi:MAG: histidinol-phosphatase HisJ [Thermodesulfobacteriota bacterium]
MLISLHGGHSGEFCYHAFDTLEDMILRYIELGFTHAGISEHIPAPVYDLMYDDEKDAGLTPNMLFDSFEAYIKKCRMLKHKYSKSIKIFVGFESEAYSGYEKFIPALLKKYRPDYIVGSVHHVNDLCFDFSREHYKKAVESCGGIINFYHSYFDKQYEMLLNIKPQVAGHFDLVRIFDPEYKTRLKEKSVQDKIYRNLEVIKAYGIIIDYNQRALLKNMDEPYPSEPVLKKALDMGINIVPGDDSHSVKDAGYEINNAMVYLSDQGVVFSESIFSKFL